LQQTPDIILPMTPTKPCFQTRKLLPSPKPPDGGIVQILNKPLEVKKAFVPARNEMVDGEMKARKIPTTSERTKIPVRKADALAAMDAALNTPITRERFTPNRK
jgi:hypothetical protein